MEAHCGKILERGDRAYGNYYLLCRYQGADNISHYRVDRIQSLVLLEDQEIEPMPLGLDLARYVRERVYPFPGDAIQEVLRCEADILSDVLDRFGTEAQDEGNGTFDAVVFTGGRRAEILGAAIYDGLLGLGAGLPAAGDWRNSLRGLVALPELCRTGGADCLTKNERGRIPDE